MSFLLSFLLSAKRTTPIVPFRKKLKVPDKFKQTIIFLRSQPFAPKHIAEQESIKIDNAKN
jgi:hypothetical protein